MEIILNRDYLNDRTLGEIYLGKVKIVTIELPWKHNQKGISCIPEGKYRITKEIQKDLVSKGKLIKKGRGKILRIHNVPNRDGVLIHPANYVRQLLGCIAPVFRHTDIDVDGKIDVANSKKAMDLLYDFLPDNEINYLIIKNKENGNN